MVLEGRLAEVPCSVPHAACHSSTRAASPSAAEGCDLSAYGGTSRRSGPVARPRKCVL